MTTPYTVRARVIKPVVSFIYYNQGNGLDGPQGYCVQSDPKEHGMRMPCVIWVWWTNSGEEGGV
jgi:hypothetical protein